VRLLAPSPSALQEMLQTCNDFCGTAGLRLNVAKCEWFATRWVAASATVAVQQQVVRRLDTAAPMRILGVHFTPSLDFRPQFVKLLRSVVNRACLRACKLPRSHARLLVTLPHELMGCGVVELQTHLDSIWLAMLHRHLCSDALPGCVLRKRMRALQLAWMTAGSPLQERHFGSQHRKRGSRWLLAHCAAVLQDNKLRYCLPPQHSMECAMVSRRNAGPQLRLLLPARHLRATSLRQLWEWLGVCTLGALTENKAMQRLLTWKEVRLQLFANVGSSAAPCWFRELERRFTDGPQTRHVLPDRLLDAYGAALDGEGFVDAQSGAAVQERLAEHLPARHAGSVLETLSSASSPLRQQGRIFQCIAALGAALQTNLRPHMEKDERHSLDWSLLVRWATLQLPTLVWLARFQRGAASPPDVQCRRCGAEAETLQHIVWRCSAHVEERRELVRDARRTIFGEFGAWSPREMDALLTAFLNEDEIPLVVCFREVSGSENVSKVKKLNGLVKKNQRNLLEMWRSHIST
jgi:hypothetical protein